MQRRQTGRPKLTPRERDLVAGILKGCTNKEIAALYGLSVQTVKNRLAGLYEKFGVSTRLQLVLRIRAEITRGHW